MKQEVAIAINNLTVSYHQRPVLRSITTNIYQGTLTAVIGPNGAGKSTLFKAVLGLIPRDAGEITAHGEQGIQNLRRRIAYIPQKEQIDWDFPVVVRDVVTMGRYPSLGWFGRITGKDRQMVTDAMNEIGISELADRHIRLLSGGQQQRIFIARALVQQADILFMDEPFVGVDSTTQTAIFALIEKLKQQGKTVVMINHDLGILQKFDYVMMINRQLIAMGPPSEICTPENQQRTYGGQSAMVDQAEYSLWGAKQ